MANFLGEIRIFAGNFPPAGWMFCDGQLLPRAENDALFTLIGTTYGGDGQNTFALPDLRGRVPIHFGASQSSYILGEVGGAEQVTLAVNQMPAHNHIPQCNSGNGSSSEPSNNFWAAQPAFIQYASTISQVNGSNEKLNVGVSVGVGGTQPHDNMLPFVGVEYIIAVEGVYPTQN